MFENGKSPLLQPLAFKYAGKVLSVQKKEVSKDEFDEFIKCIEQSAINHHLINEGNELAIAKNIERHYKHDQVGASVTSNLKYIYLYWKKSSKAQQIKIALEMVEDIEECSLGFYIRLNKILADLANPGTIDHSLQNYRDHIISIKASQEYGGYAHSYNYFLYVAERMGLGLKPNSLDPMDETRIPHITGYILKEMSQKYEPLRILLNTYNDLIEHLNRLGYSGKLPEVPYTSGDYLEWHKFIKRFLHLTEDEAPDLEELLLFDNAGQVIGINENYLRYFYFQNLSKTLFRLSVFQKEALDDLFHPQKPCHDKQLSALCEPGQDENTGIKIPALIRNESDCFTLLQFMGKSEETDNSFGKQIQLARFYKNRIFNSKNNHTLRTINFLYQLNNEYSDAPFARQFLSQNNYEIFHDSKLSEFTHQQESFKELLSLLLKYKTYELAILQKILERYLTQHKKYFDKMAQINTLLKLPELKRNQDLYQFLKKIAIRSCLKFFSSKTPDVLTRLQTEAQPDYYELMDEVLDDELLIILFNRSDEEKNHILMQVCYKCPNAIKPLVHLFEKIPTKDQRPILLQKNAHGLQLIDLLIANTGYLRFYLPLISLISRHQPEIKEKIAEALVLPDENNQNYLMYAVQSESALSLDELINTLLTLPQPTLNQLFIQENNQGNHALQMAVQKAVQKLDPLCIYQLFSLLLKGVQPELHMLILGTCVQAQLKEALQRFPELTHSYLSIIAGFDRDFSLNYYSYLPEKTESAEENIPIRILFESILNNDEVVCSDEEQMLNAMKEINVRLLSYASETLKQNIHFIIKAIKFMPAAIDYAADDIKHHALLENLAQIENNEERATACDAALPIEALSVREENRPEALVQLEQFIKEKKETQTQDKFSWMHSSLFSQKKNPNIELEAAEKLLKIFNGEHPYISMELKKIIMKPELKAIWSSHPKYQQEIEMRLHHQNLENCRQLHSTLSLSSSSDEPIAASSSSSMLWENNGTPPRLG